ncbi:MAG TPA: hypothetical protein VLF62_05290 [Candidatus Saccharimonadales bacterium]|nr:hypothetical protein [Candidatus Saccharimonadales bacterium]
MSELPSPELFKPADYEIGSLVLGGGLAAEAGVTKLAHEGTLPGVHEIPYAENVFDSYLLGATTTALSERIAMYFEADGRPKSAKVMRHAGNVTALACSVGYQIAETGAHTTTQKMAVAMGVIATVPGMIAGKSVARAPLWGVLRQRLFGPKGGQ